jgi:hypothetical protein
VVPAPERRVLEQALVAKSMRYVSGTLTYSVRPDDYLRGVLVAEVQAFVLRDHIAADYFEDHVEEPTTWWQMWKRDHAPVWFLRRFPVDYWTRTVRVRVDRYLSYPDAALPVREFGQPYIYEEPRLWTWT